MSTHVDPREASGLGQVPSPLPPTIAPIAYGNDLDGDFGNRLPSDHPAWSKDVVSLSQRFRAILAQCKPLAVRVLTFWDHHVRTIVVAGKRLMVDASGSYRME